MQTLKKLPKIEPNTNTLQVIGDVKIWVNVGDKLCPFYGKWGKITFYL